MADSENHENSLRILHLVSDTDRRGGQVFAMDLHSALVDRGATSAVHAVQPGSDGGLDIPVLGNQRLSISGSLRLRKLMSAADVTVAHGSTSVLACRLAGGGPDRPFIVRQISEAKHWLDTPSRRRRMHWYLKRSDRVVSLSGGSAQELSELIGLDDSFHAVIPNGVPRGLFRPTSQTDRLAARSLFGISQEDMLFCYIGALVPEKGVDLLIRSIADTDSAKLIVAGDGPERSRLEDMALRLAPGRTQFVGSLTDTLPVYQASDALLLASKGGDSMPAVIAEAAFCSLPTIATDVGAIGEMIDHNVTGIVTRRGDLTALQSAIKAATHNRLALPEMGHAAMALCLEQFEINPVADMWLALLQEVGLAAQNTC